jgi:hypothetical protein
MLRCRTGFGTVGTETFCFGGTGIYLDQDPTLNGIGRSTNKNERLTFWETMLILKLERQDFLLNFAKFRSDSEPERAVYHHGSTTLMYEMKIFSRNSCDTVSYIQ